ncbi:MAG: hypothetical protein HY000_21520 [Planctomycetes bacterium]|nr:hypothetical protein [Planctomycetota bacterium]
MLNDPAGLGTDTSRDTLDFSSFVGPVNLDLARTDEQVVNAGNLKLKLLNATAIEDVVGSPFSDTILGTSRANRLLGADELAHSMSTPGPGSPTVQVVFLDLDSETNPVLEHVYTLAERNAIQAALAADYAPFSFQFTQTPPAPGSFATLFFNKSFLVDGQPQPGHADEVDFRNLNLGGSVSIDINSFLGGAGQPSATSANIVAASAAIAAHELGHLVGLRHADSFGPIGSGIHSPPGPDKYKPSYPGPSAAFETTLHLMASPASVGSSANDALADPFFGEREAIKLAFASGGAVLNEQAGDHGSRATAQGVALAGLAMPNTLVKGTNAAKVFAVAAADVVGFIELGPDGHSQSDFYSFQGSAGDLINVEVMSRGLARIANPTDSIVRIYDTAGNLVAYFTSTASTDDQFENPDAAIIDLLLPSD